MREINVKDITELVEKLCIDACCKLGDDVFAAFKKFKASEQSELGKSILSTLEENAHIAKDNMEPACQDTGMTVVFVDLPQSVQIVGGHIEDAINEGVRRGYEKGFLRKSVVKDPINRVNTKDNTPAIIHYEISRGDKLRISVMPKGFGSENMSQLKMLKPSDGIEGVKNFVIKTVSEAGANPCPPVIIGVGIGGTMDKAASLAKMSLMRPIGSVNPDPQLAALEAELLEKINKLGIGPAGFGGTTTAMAVHVDTYATHIAGLPVAVNVGCHAYRLAAADL
ncbi:MAG: fumarate hydratase [Deferribacteraceae bacterium]|nr:fumarate hydratase [Deferribacteraceae bacterium]